MSGEKHMKNKNLEGKQKRTITLTAIVVALLTVAITTISVLLDTQNNKIGEIQDPEIARSMEYEQVQDGDEDIVETNGNVEFDTFFLRDLNGDGYAESIRGTCNEIGEEATLYMELNVQTEGYLKDGIITINSDNFYLQTNLPKDDELVDNYIGNNIKEIKLNQINNGTQKLITGVVRSGDYTYTSGKANAIGSNINNYSKVNSVTLTGTYVTGETEIPIEKTVEFNVDWHGTTRATITRTSQSSYIDSLINEEEGTLNLSFTVNTEEVNKELLLSGNHVEAEIPELNGYAPLEVVYTGSNAEASYNTETRILTIDRTSTIDENGNVTSKLSTTNSYSIRVTYPLEAYTSLGINSIQLRVPVSTYYEGYNNQNEEFTNPYKSNTAKTTIIATYKKYVKPEPGKPGEYVTYAQFDVTVGNYRSTTIYDTTYNRYVVSKQKPMKLYNGQSEEEKDDTYIVKWQGYIGTNTELNTITMKETQNDQEQVVDQFIKTDSSQESMEDVTSNVGIYFSGMNDLLGTEGYINVYDEETDNLLVTFTAVDWNKYTSSNPYRYELPVKHIRVEMSPAIKNDTYFYVYNVKELDDEAIITKYEREQFDELQYIKSQLVMYIGENLIGTDIHQANYEAPYSIATIGISNNTISTQVTEKNDIITIRTDTGKSISWLNGIFLVKLPEEILTAEINNIEISKSNVGLESYELIERDGINYIKIVTKNNQETTYNIKIDVDLTPDPRVATTTKNIELYATNENTSDYYCKAQDIYDVNNNLNMTEQVNYTKTSISMVSPNSLLTNQTASDYDDKGSTVVSPQVADIKPVYAVVDQEQEEQTVKIGVQIKNNYASTISEIQILGKIPFEGNTYVLSGSNLGSTFTTKMVNTGIDIPEDLLSTATVYYSTNENPDRDLTKAENNWKTSDQVENWDEIKTFLIDLGDYVMPTGQEYVFYYTVKIPNGLEFNQTAFSHHGVYFSLDTEDGKYRTQTEPNKLGFRIAEKYNIELSKFQTGKNKLVPGATYSVQEIITEEDGTETRGEAKTGVTNAQGQLTITNLYAEKTYELREIKTPDDYELNSNVIRFIGHVDDEGILTIEKTGETKQDPEVIKEDGEDYKVTVEVEDEVKASIKITKIEKETQNLVNGVRFKITGYNLPEEGIIRRTYIDGIAELNGLSVNQEYKIEEVKADGYYLINPIKFKVVNNDGNYIIEQITEEGVESGTITSQNTTEEDGIPTINITLEDEKIPTYNLQLFKIQKTTESTVSEDELIARAETDLAGTEVTPLANATFKLYKGSEELGKYTTDEQGYVTIEGLYQYESEKDIDQTYTLKEVMSPEGYAKVQDISFRVQKDEESGQLILIDESGEDRQYTVDGNTVTLTIEDSPSFKLIKKDAETKETLANIKFAIFNVDDGIEQPARNSKGEIIGTKETINGREYYTVQTNNNGELTVDLPEGLYKAVEVQAPEKYDITGKSYYFGIGISRIRPTGYTLTQAMEIDGNREDAITSVVETRDGGYIAVGYFKSRRITIGEFSLENNSITGSSDGIIIKYRSNGTVEWTKKIGGTPEDRVTSIEETKDGGYIVVGYFSGSFTIDGVQLEEIGSSLSNSDIMIIKLNKYGIAEWAKAVGGDRTESEAKIVEVRDGGYILVGSFGSNNIIVDGMSLNNDGAMIIKFDSNGTFEWAQTEAISSCSVSETEDGGFIVGATFTADNITVGDYTLTNAGGFDGILIKYNRDSRIEWATSIGGFKSDEIISVSATSDGGFIAGGRFNSASITLGEYTLTNSGSSDAMVIKYDSEGKVEWAKSIEGSDSDSIVSVASTKDGGYIVGGVFNSMSILVDGIELNNHRATTGFKYSDGMIIKFSNNGIAEWAMAVGGGRNDRISSVSEASDGGFIVGGFFSGDMTIEDYMLTDDGFGDGMILKFEQVVLGNPTTRSAKTVGGNYGDYISSVIETKDGGYIVVGNFDSSNIVVDGIQLNNKGSSDGMIIKYDSNGATEWAKEIGGSKTDRIASVVETEDGGYMVVGEFASTSILVDGIQLNNKGSSDGMVIKFDCSGATEWIKVIGGSDIDRITTIKKTDGEDYIVVGEFSSKSIVIDGKQLYNKGTKDGMIVKLDSNGIVKWAKAVGGNDDDEINSVAVTSDGDCVVGGKFVSDNIIVDGITIENKGSTDGMIIKLDSNGIAKWAKVIGESKNDEIQAIAINSNEEILVGGNFEGNSIIIGEYTITNNNSSYTDGMVIKYDKNGNVKWATGIGGENFDYITSVSETKDEGIIVVGNFYSQSITKGNYKITNVGSEDSSDGMIIKYGTDGKVEWAKSVGGSDDDQVNSVTELNDGSIIVGGYFESDTIETDGYTLTNAGNTDAMILKIVNIVGVPEVQELTVENSRKVFNITTDVNEIDGIKGGSVSGEDKNPYEEVKYGDNSTKEIVMTPDEGYEIIGITVNGEEWQFGENADGTYIMPQFTNVTEDKHIVVTYSKRDNKIVINKVDAETRKPIQGITFKLDQIEERTEPENVIGTITDNGATYYYTDISNEVTNQVTGELTNNGTYYFIQNEDETLTPTNSKTYQTAHEGIEGIQNSTANSYVKIDLSKLEGEYAVVVNANIYSESADYGYATITQGTTAPSYSSSTGRFMYISGTSSSVTTAKDYTSEVLDGGQVYYLHLGYNRYTYRAINSIKVYGITSSTYNFVLNDQGGYESNNQEQASTVANSYIPIDLKNNTGKYNLTVNANVSSESGDYGYVTVTNSTTAPAYNGSNGRFIYISGTSGTASEPTDYTTVLQGGSMYYLHLGYYKNESQTVEMINLQ